MATVYLAEDLRHKRRVALKVLKPELAAVLGAERFLQEITTTAALQHPHILPLFDSGAADGFLYYVMPFIDGETLRSKLDRETQLGIDEAVKLTIAVADALDYAHRHGVVHRDIKPENILLHDGRPTVADFGIALALSAAAGGRMTETGMSLGTPHYMSPEQATAEKDVTARSDIYSLGSVLYEMLTGSPPHVGASAQQIIMKIVTEEAQPVTRLRKAVPPNVSAALSTALEKLPADRFASAVEFARALGDPAFRSAKMMTAPSPVGAGSWRNRIAVPALVAAAVLAVALVWALGRPGPPAPVTRYGVALPTGQELARSPWSRLAVSPDGSRLVYVGNSEQGTQLYVRARDGLESTALPGTQDAINPALSPDGARVAFMDRVGRGNIKVVSLTGGLPVTITDSAVGVPGISWGFDGFIYYDRSGVGTLIRVPEGGGAAEGVGQLDSARGELQHAWPDALPNARGIIMTASRGGPGAMGGAADEIAVLDLATGKHRTLVRGIFARYARSGHLLYVTEDGALMAVPFDQDRMELTGEAILLAQGLAVRRGGGGVDLAISDEGLLWYVAGHVGSEGTLEPVWVGRDGSASPVAAGWSGLMSDPVLSPDGRSLAVEIRNVESQVWVRDLEQGTLSRLTVEGKQNRRPAWTADGRSLAFVSEVPSGLDLYQRIADGSRPASLLLHSERRVEEATFSPDGAWLVYRSGSAAGEGDLHARRSGTDSSIALVATAAYETSPALSPDGRWLAYVSNEGGAPEVYVSPFPNTGDARWQISVQGGQEPVWAHSGRELFYRAPGAGGPQQMVIELQSAGPKLQLGARRSLFPLPRYWLSSDHQQYAVTPDDQRFLMIRATGTNRSDRLVVVENAFALLRTGPLRGRR
jgi:serine/threonine-protein kinase